MPDELRSSMLTSCSSLRRVRHADCCSAQAKSWIERMLLIYWEMQKCSVCSLRCVLLFSDADLRWQLWVMSCATWSSMHPEKQEKILRENKYLPGTDNSDSMMCGQQSGWQISNLSSNKFSVSLDEIMIWTYF